MNRKISLVRHSASQILPVECFGMMQSKPNDLLHALVDRTVKSGAVSHFKPPHLQPQRLAVMIQALIVDAARRVDLKRCRSAQGNLGGGDEDPSGQAPYREALVLEEMDAVRVPLPAYVLRTAPDRTKISNLRFSNLAC